MDNAFVAIVPTRPCPLFGRPVHRRDSSHRFRPGASPLALRIPPRGGHPALPISSRPARRYPRFWIWCSPSEHQWDFNPPEHALPSAHYGPLRHPRRRPPSNPCRASRPLVARGLPTLQQTTLPACRSHYPGGPRWLRLSVLHHCAAAFLPLGRSRRPRLALSRPAQDSLALRPAGLLGAPTCTLCLRGFSTGGCPPSPPG